MTRFSRVNECMGAMAGDELLITFARRLVSALRPSDVLARTSGDEFGILMRLDRGPGDALRAAERIKAVLTLPFRLSELEIRVDCAIGCAILNQGVASADEVFRNAQFALKNAKQMGTTQIYEPVQAEAVRRRFSMETELRCAIETDGLTLAYQPLIELKTGRVAGFEALARWTDDEGRVIPPDRVHPGRRGIGADRPARPLGAGDGDAHARRLGPRRRDASCRSASASTCRRSRSAATTSPPPSPPRSGASGISGARLTVELTESAIIQDPERAAKALNALKRARRPRRDGRFRHRLHLARLDAAAADRRAQDRPALRRAR